MPARHEPVQSLEGRISLWSLPCSSLAVPSLPCPLADVVVQLQGGLK